MAVESSGGSASATIGGLAADANTINGASAGLGVTVDGADSSAIISHNVMTTIGDGIDINNGSATINANAITAAVDGIAVTGAGIAGIGDGTIANANQIDANFAGVDIQGTAQVTIDRNSLFNDQSPVSGAGVQIEGGTVSIEHNTFGTGGIFDTDIEAMGGTPITLTSNVLTAGSTYIDNETSNYIDATTNTFGGNNPATLSPGNPADLATLYGIEDKIVDGIDQSSSGLVRIKADDLFVAQSSETPNAGSIQRP